MLVLSVLLLLVAATLLALRGRRTDDHPLCRRCGYDLTGRSLDTTRCGECGADLSKPGAIRLGHRSRRVWLISVGGVLSATLIVMGGVVVRGIDLMPHKPFWWLQHDLECGRAAQSTALAELTARVASNRLTTSQTAAVVDRALVAELTAPFNPEWGTFIETAKTAGRVDARRWAAHAGQTICVSLVVRRSIRRGDPLPAEVRFDLTRMVATPFSAEVFGRGFNLDGRPIPLGGPDEATCWGGVAQAFMSNNVFDSTPRIVGDQTRAWSVGRHVLSANLRMYVGVEGAFDANPADVSKAMTAIDVPVSAAVEVVDVAHDPPLTMVDPAQRVAVAAAITVVEVTATDSGHVRFTVQIKSPPVRLALGAAVRPTGGGRELASDDARDRSLSVGSGETGGANIDLAGSIGGAQSVDITFRPNLNGLRDDVDATPIWGEPIVVRGVPVTRMER